MMLKIIPLIDDLKSDSKRYKNILSGSIRSNKEIISDLLDMDLTSDDDFKNSILLFAELLKKRSLFSNYSVMERSYWRRDYLASSFTNGLMQRVVSKCSKIEEHVMRLYEDDFGSTRETILFLDQMPHPDIVVYLHNFILNALHHYYPKQTTEKPQQLFIESLFEGDKKLLNWTLQLKKMGKKVKDFSGQTNTLLGLYTNLFNKTPELQSFFSKAADLSIDLGGGFATPEISMCTKIPFVCFDLNTPQKYFDLGLRVEHDDNSKGIDLKTYEQDLKGQAFEIFDVFENSFPRQFNVYNISSFGFLNSDVHSLSEKQPEGTKEQQKINRMLYSLYRVLELARIGKEIYFMTYGRPQVSYRNRLVMTKFKNSKITEVIIPSNGWCEHVVPYENYPKSALNRQSLINFIQLSEEF